MPQIKVSAIVPVYNKEKYLSECLDSLLNQSLKEIEIICIDDGSTDNSLKIMNKYASENHNIKIISQENHGPGYARNEGIKIAEGKYLSFIDADDWIKPETYEILYDNALKYKSEIVLFNALEHLPENKYRTRIYYTDNINGTFDFHQRKDIVMNNFLIVCTKLHKRDFIKENNIRFSDSGLFEDVYFHVKSVIKAEKISYVNQIFYNYRRTESNTRQNTSVKSEKNILFMDVLNEIKFLLFEEEIYDELEENYIKFKLTELNNLFNNEENPDFLKILKNDFNENPIDNNKLEKLPEDLQLFYNNINETDSNQKKRLFTKNKLYSIIKKFFF